jgi:hypothetical protein
MVLPEQIWGREEEQRKHNLAFRYGNIAEAGRVQCSLCQQHSRECRFAEPEALGPGLPLEDPSCRRPVCRLVFHPWPAVGVKNTGFRPGVLVVAQ